MIYFFVLALIWTLITLFGHASWVVVAAIFRGIVGQQDPLPPARPSTDGDEAATHRVITRLNAAGIIDSTEARRLRSKLTELQATATTSTSPAAKPQHPPVSAPPAAGELAGGASASGKSAANAPGARRGDLAPERRPSDSPVKHRGAGRPAPVSPHAPVSPESTPASPPKSAVPASSPATALSAASPVSPEASASPSGVRASAGKSLAEFLAEHNIRWGELIAGLLIVVCSIGLVVSLWSTITGMHRVIPSLIFLCGNTAIFGAGLYTLFRWRLQDTSRATLVIATLLVPLGILAGLSTGGIGATSVFLDDPVVLVSILGAGAVYITLLWQSSRALVGGSSAPAMTLGVAGPAAVLPLVPASVRTWGSSAGFIVVVGSVAVMVSAAWMVTRARRLSGRAAGRRALVIGVTSFSLVVLAAYAAFMLRATESGWLAIAASVLPGGVLLASTAASITADKRHPKLALAGNSFASIFLTAAASLLIPMMTSMGWLWIWAVSFSSALAVSIAVFRKPGYLSVAFFPVGLACLLSSPALAGDVVWSELPTWRRLLGGEPMLASIMVGVLGMLPAIWVRRGRDQNWVVLSSAGWLCYGAANALILTFAPAEWMGVVPAWGLSALLAVLAIALVAATRKISVPLDPRWVAAAGSAVIVAFWFSVLRPVVYGQAFSGLLPVSQTLLATAITVIVASEFLRGHRPVAAAYRMLASAWTLGGALAGWCLVFLATENLSGHHANTERAILVLMVGMVCWMWIGWSGRDRSSLGFARGCLVVTAVLVGHRFFDDQLMTREAWRGGSALWAWSALGWSVVAAIGVRDWVLHWGQSVASRREISFLSHRIGWYERSEESWDAKSKHAVIVFSVVLSTIATTWAFASLVLNPGAGLSLEFDSIVVLPLLVLGLGALALRFPALIGNATDETSPVLSRVHLASILAWSGWQIATRALEDPVEQLVVATSIIAAVCLLIDLLRGERLSLDTDLFQGNGKCQGLLTAIGLVAIVVSSASLLVGSWLPAIRSGVAPDTFVTLSVAAWWSAAAVTYGWLGYRHRSSGLLTVAAVLVPSLVILVMPLWLPGSWWIWFQSAAIASGVVAITLHGSSRALSVSAQEASAQESPSSAQGLQQEFNETGLRPAIDVSLIGCVLVGVASALWLMVGVLGGDASLLQLHNVAGVTLSILSACLIVRWNQMAVRPLRHPLRVTWPLVLSLSSAHLALLLSSQVFVLETPRHLIAMIWTVFAFVAIADTFRGAFDAGTGTRFGRWHAGILIVAASCLTMLDAATVLHESFGLLACVAAGTLATSIAVIGIWQESRGGSVSKLSVLSGRLWGIFTIVMGAGFVFEIIESTSRSPASLSTAMLGWAGIWALIWRLSCPDRLGDEGQAHRSRLALADSEASFLVLLAVIVETVVVYVAPGRFASENVFSDGLLWIRLGVAAVTCGGVCFRYRRRGIIELSVVMFLVAATLLGLRIGIERSAAPATLVTIVCLTGSILFTAAVFASESVCRVVGMVDRTWRGIVPVGSVDASLTRRRFAESLLRVFAVPAVVVLGFNTALLVGFNSQAVIPLAICGVALLAIAIAELSEQTGRDRLRQGAMVLGLTAVAMWASFNVAESSLPFVALSTRWFVGWVFVCGAFGFAAPKMLGPVTYDRWREAIRSGLVIALGLAVLSLTATLVQEGVVRVSGQTDRLVTPLYLGMAAMLATLSGLCVAAGVLSGPGFAYREQWQLTDRQRTGLIIAAQALGGLTWFHLFLCKSPLASLGLRPYWPYVVLALSFGSVGITEWAKRRGDEVLDRTLKQTALFLPLVPVIGFWMSGSWVTALMGESNASGWMYIGGRVSYQVLLVAAALYYGVISFLWKSSRARVVSIVIGNMALWVILMQTPNWDFLAHPQAWLIPPAVCVLILTHLHRESLGAKTAASIRYAATLAIYITSTADMLIQGIGSTIWGPIVLVLLALVGAGVGVALRVRPFLYLGTTFVFVGVTSMVWHAQRQIDAVWPWWAFGISTGVLLLVGLMAVEKNKPQLQRIATAMQQWET